MAFLIDGFNLIYKFPELEEKMYQNKLNDARKGLLDILKGFQQIKKTHIRVVFDGKKNPSHNLKSETIGTIDVYYSLDFSADHLIKQFIKKDLNPRMTTVVTSDKDIIFFVNRFRTKVMESEKFAKYVENTIEEFYAEDIPEKEENPQLSDDELNYWEDMFKNK